nr:hypothetical protein [Rhodococcus opacus]
MAMYTMVSWWSGLVSESRTQRRCLLIQAKVRSTHQTWGRTWNPVLPGDAFDDLNPKGDDLVRPAYQPPGVASVGPDQPDRGEGVTQTRE